ncbi:MULTISPECIES: hypothetical protein [Streptomyces]|uniref:Uncharacterized protein n=1 Tax=Streptomyces tsukubensis (strain DSM 42081 / NBRC 108919 / NRRL 18488 / 9993) TaxID=1114943 RepID=I2N8S5_STRT9|nr:MULTISPECIES: hypothetical protein [Streptomyces]AZK97292.1 hypothetical protein B7R87_27980 [Streptomyces tsukubensis]EIF93422.1 hypothetical protein [Streptomyces tsukubensis NRRL18488]MYS64053.1 hypothetical protein [Streptomyces sp. SID5473]QKM66745.1 hypothetical protein STSU_005785 [Streptomyces tsukubensis NRRL18488]TAI44907.1 hypothetical protein EWI31_06445 [Streptomyces tsukubensis]
MTRIAVPGPAGAEPGGARLRRREPVPPAASDACRYLCAGVHADDRFRSAVIDELSVHEERFTAPSFGIDAARILAHATYARRRELGWALAVLAVWVLAVPLAGGYFVVLLCPGIVLALLAWADSAIAKSSALARGAVALVRWSARLLLAYVLALLLWDGIADQLDDGSYRSGFGIPTALSLPYLVFDERPRSYGLLAVFFYALLVFLVGLRHGQSAQVLTGPLSATGFRDQEADPAERSAPPHTRRRMAEIRHEQHAKLVMYHSDNPFRGAGRAFQPWTLSVELRPRKDTTPEALDNRTVLDRVRPLVDALTVPSPHDSPRAADAVRDRLRELRTDEVVFLPADGIDSREAAPYDPAEAEDHHLAAVEEGGEARRHFLRIRVGGWYEDVVVTVFVRVHTQGGMLVLEVAPHVLMPVRNTFREAEREAHRYLAGGTLGRVAWAVAHTPAGLTSSVRTVYRAALAAWERSTGGHRWALPEGPAVAVRELGAQGVGSLFQQMDVLRYLQSIQDRISEGVKDALRDAGWQTDEFEQKIVHVNGGVYIESAHNSAFGFGEQSTAHVGNVGNVNDASGFGKGERHGRKAND